MNVIYFWHCQLSHINESRINKLYKDKFFDPYDFELYETCKSCLMSKMTNTSFTGHGEKASDILILYILMFGIQYRLKSKVDTPTSSYLLMICLGLDICI